MVLPMHRLTIFLLLFALLILGACRATFTHTLPPELTHTTWRLTTIVDASPIVPARSFELIFVDSDGGSIRVSGGCNNFFSPYRLGYEGEIRFNLARITLLACLPEEIMEQDEYVFSLLQEVVSYRFTAETLILQTSKGEELIFARS